MLARFVLPLLQRLASDTACRLGGALGVLAWRLGVRRRLVNASMAQTLGLRGPQRARLSRRAYATMGANFIEIWTAGGVDGVEKHVSIANPAWTQHLRARQNGLVMATAHLGSWDGAVIGSRLAFTRVLAYAKAQHHPEVDALLNQRRQINGVEMLLTRQGDRTGAVTVVKALRTGGTVGLLADQRPRREEATPATFLGQPTWCHPGPAFFAQKTKTQIAPGFALRIRAGETRIYFLRPFDISDLSPERATQRVMDALSAMIAAFPGQYFWHHRRFSDPPETCPAANPLWRTGVTYFRTPPTC